MQSKARPLVLDMDGDGSVWTEEQQAPWGTGPTSTGLLHEVETTDAASSWGTTQGMTQDRLHT